MLREPWNTDRFAPGEGLRRRGREPLMVGILTGGLLSPYPVGLGGGTLFSIPVDVPAPEVRHLGGNP